MLFSMRYWGHNQWRNQDLVSGLAAPYIINKKIKYNEDPYNKEIKYIMKNLS